MSDGEHRNARVAKLEQRVEHLERALGQIAADLVGLAQAHNAIAQVISDARGAIVAVPPEPPSA